MTRMPADVDGLRLHTMLDRRTFGARLAATGVALATASSAMAADPLPPLNLVLKENLMTKTESHETAPTRFVEVNGVQFAYRRFGKEGLPPLVFLQHFTGTMDNWDPILTNRLAKDRPVVLFDNAGIGRSTGATPDSVSGMARDAISFIGTLGAPKVDLFGFSLGSFVAQQIAVDSPGLIRRIILAGAGPKGGEGMSGFSPRVQEIFGRPNSTTGERMVELFFAPTPTSQAAGKAWLERISARQQDREPPSSPAVAGAQLTAMQAWGKVAAERYADLKKIAGPVLVVNGHDDIMIPTVNSFILQQELPNARLILYPDSGHGAQFQYSRLFAEEAAGFIGD
jgi:pimeloyl-ACP methyl ester carboxylesterase